MTLAASGSPNRMVTLTCSPAAEPDATKARALLHSTWRILRLAIARELARPGAERWLDRKKRRLSPSSRPIAQHGGDELVDKPRTLPYFAVVERHKSGRPHLHVLLRCGFIPQRWLSAQMRRLANSPICDIRKVSGTKQAAAYVAKYIGKQPARFGNSRAYWYSSSYAPQTAGADDEEVTQDAWFRAAVRHWPETLEEIERFRPVIDVTSDGWFSFEPGRRLGVVLVYLDRWKGPYRDRLRTSG